MTTQNITQRFWHKVNKSPGLGRDGDCWQWKGRPNQWGYGVVTFAPFRHQLAHRVAWFLEYKKWPTPMGLHTCDNPICVRTAHLYEGTNQDNSDDKVRRNRQPKGITSPVVKMTEEQARIIKITVSNGGRICDAAKTAGVHYDAARAIARGDTWKHLSI